MPEDKKLAQIGYDAFRKAEFGIDGVDNLPEFERLPIKEQEAWRQVAEAVRLASVSNLVRVK